MKKDFLKVAPLDYIWPQCPEADAFIRERIENFLGRHTFAGRLSRRMQEETSTEFQMWVDHFSFSKTEISESALTKLGYIRDRGAQAPKGSTPYWHPFADLPRVVLVSGRAPTVCAIAVDNITDFELAHGLSIPIDGAPYSTYREASLHEGQAELRIVERRGSRAFITDREKRASAYLEALETWTNRARRFDSTSLGMKYTEALAQKLVRNLGTGMAACAFLEGERRYWQTRNRAAGLQKSRQDRLGLGWANHDHHTFRSSRTAFAALIRILQTFGFKKRERYYAGAEAGWGAQIMEQPESRLIIFADVDLTPEETEVDFSSDPLPDSAKLGTVGLWCALHGESMLEAGMHHLEAKFDFEHLRGALVDVGVNFMKPFSDFPHLRQAFSEGETWMVEAARLEALRTSNRISWDAYERIKQKGAVGSHMENLQRRNGFKGFNQKGVSQIIREVNPEAQALKGATGRA